MATERKWTEAQSRAIRERNRTLLLSAAAGSGKTATLTQRVIESITDAESPTDVTRLLVVTFTNAAAGELRDRISGAIADALKASPGDLRLSRQLLLLPDADICTIDGFCRKLIRDHTAELGLAPDFRIGDEAEVDCIMRSVMEQLVTRAYEGEETFASEEGFCRFADHLVSSKNEAALIDILCLLYEKTDGFPSGVGFYRDYSAFVATQIYLPPEKTPWGRRLCRSAAQLASEYRLAFASARAAMEGSPDAEAKYCPAADGDLAYLERLAEAAEEGYEQVRLCLASYRPISLKSIREPSEETEGFKELRARFKAKLKDLAEHFLYTADEWRPFLAEFAEVTACLAALMTRFDELFSMEKRRRNLLSFGDLEHFALELLTENRKPTPLAREIGSHYDAVYVDEYQDVNSVQHSIFEAIAGERNRFMVGDIKQSIYSFRLAEPDIFASLRAAFPPLDEAGDSPTASIFMSENFRCDETVIDFVNAVFDRLLGAAGESIGYRPEDRLTFAKGQTDGAEPSPAVLAVFHKEKTTASEVEEDGERTEKEAADPEPLWVAEEIERLLDGSRLASGKPIEPSDIAILLRSTKSRASVYRDALGARGIPAVSEDKDDFFLNPEILLALCLLNTVDNPRRDIYLSGLLLSPLYRFLPEELLEIRRGSEKSIPLYDALVAYVGQHPDFEKGAHFLERLSFMRESAEGMPIDRLLLLLFSETGLLSVGGADGKGGRQNLLLLYHYARSFAASSFKGLYQFIEYVNEIIRNRRTFRSVSESTADENAVRIMTIHGSKGLEFPVCFVADCGKSLRSKDLKNTWLFDGRLGLALMLRDRSGFARVNNPIRLAVSDSISEKTAEEELRLLYVALTRARERLYVTGCVPANQSFENFLAKCRLSHRTLSGSAVRDAASYLEWVLSALGENGGGVATALIDPPVSEASEPSEAEQRQGEAASEDPALTKRLCERFSFVYPYAHLGKLPGKLSVSRLSPSVLDGSDDTAKHYSSTKEDGECQKPPRLPLFYGGEDPAIGAKRGTATHEFLQFCDLAALRQNGAQSELDRLISEKFLAPYKAELVRLDEIERFRESPLLNELLSAKRIYRELRFNSMLPAVLFTEDASLRLRMQGKSILVQGVIDCLFETASGELVLIDYKTDRVDRRDSDEAKQRLLLRHREQLLYYAMAIRRMLGRAPDRILLYSLCLADTVSLDTKNLPLPEEQI